MWVRQTRRRRCGTRPAGEVSSAAYTPYGGVMRFQVSSVMDAIERRLTTDVVVAQAVADLGQVARFVDLDGGRPVNLVRIGMLVDALGRYLVDEGAMVYGVVARQLLSEPALTSKERMVLGRWADDGLIEVVSAVDGRAAEVADLTGLPLVTPVPEPDLAGRYDWVAGVEGRLLRLVARHGVAALSPSLPDGEPEPPQAVAPVVAAAKVPPEKLAGGEVQLPLPAEVLTGRGAVPISRTRVARRRFLRGEPSAASVPLLSRTWRCDGYDCPAFGDRRPSGQPVPGLRDGVAVCPKHGEPVVEVGRREPAYPVSIVIDDLPRRRLVVRAGQPVQVGRREDDPDVVSVGRWLHEAAAAWISPVHLLLEAREDGLVVTDLSEQGTTVWQRQGPDDHGATRALRRAAHPLGEWDTVELYTGIELARGDRRLATVIGRDEPASVLIDAPTAANRQVSVA
jgi:hypothetical protein